MPSLRAFLAVITPCDVLTMAMPRPRKTVGKFVVRFVDPQARLADALDGRDDLFAVAGAVLEGHFDFVLDGLLHDFIGLDIALFVQDAQRFQFLRWKSPPQAIRGSRSWRCEYA